MDARIRHSGKDHGLESAVRLLQHDELTVVYSAEELLHQDQGGWVQRAGEDAISLFAPSTQAGVQQSIDKLVRILDFAHLDLSNPSVNMSFVELGLNSLADPGELARSLKSGGSEIKMMWEFQNGCNIAWYCDARQCAITLFWGGEEF
jgi:hypothetical protein